MKKQRWKGDSFYFRALVSLVIVAVISLTLVFSFFYPQILNSARNSMEDQRVNSMEQTVQAMDKIFDQINTIASIIERDPTLRPYSLHSGETLALYEGLNEDFPVHLRAVCAIRAKPACALRFHTFARS